MLRRPLPVAILLGLIAEALFLFRLATPHKMLFDEVHYVPAARTLWLLSGPANIEHPLLGKALIGLGIALFGDNSFGWRVLSTVAGSATVVGVFAIAWLLWGRLRSAVVAAIVVLLNFTVFIQARIAMLDGFMAAFVVCGLACLLWAMRSEAGRVWPRWLAGAAQLGLGIGCKWVALPYVGYAGLALLWVRWRDRRTGTTHAPGMATIPALLALGLVAGVAYLLTFAPAFFYHGDAMTLAKLLPFQRIMYAEQTQVLPPHPYQSAWWTWAIDRRPIWYLYEVADGHQRGVLMLGNPAVLWGGLVAVAACLWAGRRDPRLLAAAGLWVGSYAMWAVIPKSLGFFYYYYLSSIWLALPIAGALGHWRRLEGWDEACLVLVACLFVYFWPIISAAPLGGPQAFQHWMWFRTWP